MHSACGVELENAREMVNKKQNNFEVDDSRAVGVVGAVVGEHVTPQHVRGQNWRTSG